MIHLRYLKSVLLGFLLCWIIFILAVFYQIGVPTESSRWIDEIYKIKSTIADSIKTPKLVVVSGSNALFGISCQIIQEESGVPCVNGGTHGGLDIEYILNRSRSWLKPEDTVLLSIEYDLYKHDSTPRNILVDYVVARDPKYLFNVDLITQVRFLSGISFERVIEGILNKSNPPTPKQTGYQAKTLNEYGDETNNRKADMTEKELKMNANLKPEKNAIKSSYGMKKINEFVKWCKTNRIKVIAIWPSTVWYDLYKEPSQQEFFQKLEDFYKNLKIPILGKPRDFMYDKSMFYDTNYHLNDIGMRYRTKQLIDLLKPYLGDTDKVKNKTSG
jgi:hypothetical protein